MQGLEGWLVCSAVAEGVSAVAPISRASPTQKQLVGVICHIDDLSEQFGFLKGKSCLSQLLSLFHNWTHERSKGLTTDVIFLDLSKAFDLVPYERLLTKIHSYGIQGSLLSWFRCSLTNRHQPVVLRRHHSSWTSVLSGVP